MSSRRHKPVRAPEANLVEKAELSAFHYGTGDTPTYEQLAKRLNLVSQRYDQLRYSLEALAFRLAGIRGDAAPSVAVATNEASLLQRQSGSLAALEQNSDAMHELVTHIIRAVGDKD